MAVLNSGVSGQLAVQATTQQLPSGATLAGVLVGNLKASTASIFIGGSTVSTTNGLELVAGNPPVLIPVSDASALYVRAAATGTSTLTYLVV